MYLAAQLKPLGIKITRIAQGVPVGSDLDYIDQSTMIQAFEGPARNVRTAKRGARVWPPKGGTRLPPWCHKARGNVRPTALFSRTFFRMTFRRSCRAGFCALLFCLCFCLPLWARAQAPASSAVTGRTAWDANYLYLAFQVDDANLSGTNSAPLSNPEQDDSVAVYLQVGQSRPDAPDANITRYRIGGGRVHVFVRRREQRLARASVAA
jgi:hypothetical protein